MCECGIAFWVTTSRPGSNLGGRVDPNAEAEEVQLYGSARDGDNRPR